MANRCSFVVVTGMHRSHTSLLASLLQSGGLDVGSSLVGADPSNPHGHFEDTGLVDIHEQILAENGLDWRVSSTPRIVVSPAQARRAHDAIQRRCAHANGPWGFKIPHAALLLDFWGEFPGAKFAFIVREPEPVIRSMLSRAGGQAYWKAHFWWQCRTTYSVYNEAIARFLELNVDRCTAVSSRALLQRPVETCAAISHHLGLGLRPVDPAVVNRSLTKRSAPPVIRTLARTLARSRRAQRAYADVVRHTHERGEATEGTG